MYSKSYDANGQEITFNFETDNVRYTVVFEGESIAVNSYNDGIRTVKALKEDGIMSFLKVEKLYYVKFCHALNSEYQPVYRYAKRWRKVN